MDDLIDDPNAFKELVSDDEWKILNSNALKKWSGEDLPRSPTKQSKMSNSPVSQKSKLSQPIPEERKQNPPMMNLV